MLPASSGSFFRSPSPSALPLTSSVASRMPIASSSDSVIFDAPFT
jgi:hypothetical protein